MPPVGRLEPLQGNAPHPGPSSFVLPPISEPPTSSKGKQRIRFKEEAADASGDKKGASIGSPSSSPKRKAKEDVWDEKHAFKELPTNAFGKLEFANDEARSKPAKVQINIVMPHCTTPRVYYPHVWLQISNSPGYRPNLKAGIFINYSLISPKS